MTPPTRFARLLARPGHRFARHTRPRGSVLILVVALLVLLAFVGTAFLTTTRYDRTAAVQHVTNTQKDFVFDAAVKYVESSVLADVLDPAASQKGGATSVRPPSNILNRTAYVPIDNPLTDPFLADRLPFLQFTWGLAPGGGTPVARPAWRAISWPEFGTGESGLGYRFDPPDNNRAVNTDPTDNGPIVLVRDWQPNVAYKAGEVVAVQADSSGLQYHYVRTANSPGALSSFATQPRGGLPVWPTTGTVLWEKCDPKQFFTFAPATVPMPDGRNYPAFYVFNNYVANLWRTSSWDPDEHAPYVLGPTLAADADGDGIADAGYRKMPLGTLNGLTYFLAMRVVDNGSAINLNTAWAGDSDFFYEPGVTGNAARLGTLANFGFFPSNIGLRELLFSANIPGATGEPTQAYPGYTFPQTPVRYYIPGRPLTDPSYEPLLEITRHNLFRFGYPDGTGTFSLGLVPVDDIPDAGGSPTERNDFAFRTQGEALFTQLARRPQNPGFADNNGPSGAPDGNFAVGQDETLRWIELGSDGAALAFRGGAVANLLTVSPVEQRFTDAVNGFLIIDSLYGSAANRHPAIGSAGLAASAFNKDSYPLVPNRTDGTNAAADAWFDASFNFDRWYDTTNSRFTLDPTNDGQVGFYRSMRPLVVTSNPVANVVPPRTIVAGRAEVPTQVTDVAFNTAAGNGSVATGFGQINVGLGTIAQANGATTNLPVTLAADTISGVGELDAAAGIFSIMRQYRQPTVGALGGGLSDTTAKVPANTAEFGELWRAFWNVMAEEWGTGNVPGPADPQPLALNRSGTAFEREIEAYETQLAAAGKATAAYPTILNPYHGSRFNSISPTDPTDFTPGTTATTPNALGVAGSWTQLPDSPNPPDSASTIPAADRVEYHPARMFRSPIRSFTLNRSVTPITSNQFYPPFVNPAGPLGFAPNAPLPRLRPDQMMLLRSAIAAANAEDLRDPDFRVTRRTIQLRLQGQTPDLVNGTALIDPLVAVTINGFEPQPFITEVYANTDVEGLRNSAQNGTANSGVNAPWGYVAIELHNPYPFPMDIRYCKFAIIDRFNEQQPGYPAFRVVDAEEDLPATERIEIWNATSNLGGATGGQAGATDYMQPTIIPANGYLVLENFDAYSGSGNRPQATGLPVDGPVDRAVYGPRANFAHVANLHKLLNREFVLMRPVDVETQPRIGGQDDPLLAPLDITTDPGMAGPNTQRGPYNGFVRRRMDAVIAYAAGNAEATSVRTLLFADPVLYPAGANYRLRAPRTPAVDMVPMDSFDFTGLTLSTLIPGDPDFPPAIPASAYIAGTARAWHYVRANASVNTLGQPGAGGWRFVYPGRYDGTKYARATGLPLPRQQGTRVSESWAQTTPDPDADEWIGGIPVTPANLGRPDDRASYEYNFLGSQLGRGTFSIPLVHRGSAPFGLEYVGSLLGGFYPAISTTFTGAYPFPTVGALPRHLPFGGFARRGDLLQVPYIGSYRIQLPAYIASEEIAPGTGGAALRDFVIELNAITMDAAMADDTDVNTDPVGLPPGTPASLANARYSDIGYQSREQIGRFVPLRKSWLPADGTVTGNDPFSQTEPAEYTIDTPTSVGVLYDDGVTELQDPNPPPGTYAWTTFNRYRWANDLFDYLAVQSAPNDFLPNLQPDLATTATPVRNVRGAAANSASEVAAPVEGQINLNTASERVLAMLPWVPLNAVPTDVPQYTISPGDQFTINPVTSVVTVGADGVLDNLQIARAVVRFRQGFEARNSFYLTNGAPAVNFASRPFLSPWDLYRVPEFRNLQALLLDPAPENPATNNPDFNMTLRANLDDRAGDVAVYAMDFFSPQGSAWLTDRFFGVGDTVILDTGERFECIQGHKSDGSNAPGNTLFWRDITAAVPPPLVRGVSRPRFDFGEQSLLLNRVSNLVTTRSDMFTVYLLLEGWENAGTEKAALRVSRRAAFFLDRSQVTPDRIELKAPVPIPTE